MSSFEDGCYSSSQGYALIAKVLAGRCQMRYTRVAVGNGAIPEGQTPRTMAVPAGYVMDGRIASVSNPVDGECQVTVQIFSRDVETGFFVTGLLLYAEDPDEGEIPYTYFVLENEPEWVRPASAAVGKLATFDMIAAVGSVDTVFATIDPEAVVTLKQVKKMLEPKQDKLTGSPGQVLVFGEDGELEAQDFSGAKVFAFIEEDWGPPASLEGNEESGSENPVLYDGSRGWEITVPASVHGRKDGDFGFQVFHRVDGKYITNTWGALGTGVEYDGETGNICIQSEDPYSGKILFVG